MTLSKWDRRILGTVLILFIIGQVATIGAGIVQLIRLFTGDGSGV